MDRKNRMLLLGLGLGAIAVSAAAQPGHTVYEIEVSAPGTKSQGLRGTLYDDGGRPVGEGAVVETGIGSFRWIPCRMLWETCGRWRNGVDRPRSTYPRDHRTVLQYRVVRETRRGRTFWTGELVGLGGAAARGRPVDTPMGVFRWTMGRVGSASWRGWVPEDWPDLPLADAGQRPRE